VDGTAASAAASASLEQHRTLDEPQPSELHSTPLIRLRRVVLYKCALID